MAKKKYRVWDYEWMLWKKAIQGVFAFYKTDPVAWLGSLVGLALTVAALRYLGGYQIMYEQILYLKAALIGFIGTGIFYILVYRMSAPIIAYRNKEAEANIYTWNDVYVTIHDFPRDSTFGAGLEIKTDKLLSDTHRIPVWIEIEEIWKGRDKVYENHPPNARRVPWIYPYDNDWRLNWENEKYLQDDDKSSIFIIASMDNSTAWIEKSKIEKLNMEIGVEYKLQLQINLMLPEMQLTKPLADAQYIVIYQKDKNGKMEILFRENRGKLNV